MKSINPYTIHKRVLFLVRINNWRWPSTCPFFLAHLPGHTGTFPINSQSINRLKANQLILSQFDTGHSDSGYYIITITIFNVRHCDVMAISLERKKNSKIFKKWTQITEKYQKCFVRRVITYIDQRKLAETKKWRNSEWVLALCADWINSLQLIAVA
jgi:hypothetical protein